MGVLLSDPRIFWLAVSWIVLVSESNRSAKKWHITGGVRLTSVNKLTPLFCIVGQKHLSFSAAGHLTPNQRRQTMRLRVGTV